ncbi:MAG: TonB-dependent receptor [Pseudomonadales bacterium]|nr:TonB-dependent receptor [Pseudomonadales bacterium]
MSNLFRFIGCCSLSFLAIHSASLAAAADASDRESAQIEEITIVGSTAGAKQMTGAARFIGPERLEAFHHSDIQKVLREVPGVSLQIEDGYGLRPNISIRGVASERSSRITLLEDNILIAPAPYSAPSAYYFPTMGRMHAVEVLKGPAAISQGPYTIGGALNLVSTPIANRAKMDLFAEAGSDATQRLHFTAQQPLSEQAVLMMDAHHWRSDGFQTIDRSDRETGLSITDYTAKLRVRSNDARHEWVAKLQTTQQSSNQSYLGLTDQDFGQSPTRRYGLSELDSIETDHKQQVLFYRFQATPTTELEVALYNNEHARNWFKTEKLDIDGSQNADSFAGKNWLTVIQTINTAADSGLAEPYQSILDGAADTAPGSIGLRANAREYFSRGVQAKLTHSLQTGSIDYDFEAGLRLHKDGEDRLQRDSTYHQSGGQLLLDDLGRWGNAGNRLQTAEAVAAYFQSRITFKSVLISPGLRLERIRQDRTRWETRADRTTDPADRSLGNLRDQRRNKVQVLLPGVGLLWPLSPAVSVVAGVHRGFTTPSNAPGVEPETALNYELGFRTSGRTAIEAIYFLSDYDNLLGQCTASSGAQCNPGDSFNGNAATVRGLELTAQRDFATQAGLTFSVNLNYTYLDGHFDTDIADTAFFGDVQAGDPIPYLPQHQLHIGLGFLTSHWSHYLDFSYQDAVCVKASCNPYETTESQATLDLSSHYELNARTSIFAKIENLADQTNLVARQPYGARPNRGRTMAFGFSVSL